MARLYIDSSVLVSMRNVTADRRQHNAAWAESREAFASRVQREAEEIDCIACEIEDAAGLERRLEAAAYPEGIYRHAHNRKKPPGGRCLRNVHYSERSLYG
jgi:hypothetical protein